MNLISVIFVDTTMNMKVVNTAVKIKLVFEPDHDRIIAKAKENNISVVDVIALMNM